MSLLAVIIKVQEAGLKWRLALLEYSLHVVNSISAAQLQSLKPRIKKMLSALFTLPSKVLTHIIMQAA